MISNMQLGVSIEDQIKEAKRELGMREYKYPEWVKAGKMSQAKAAEQIHRMKAVVCTLEEVARLSTPQQGLF